MTMEYARKVEMAVQTNVFVCQVIRENPVNNVFPIGNVPIPSLMLVLNLTNVFVQKIFSVLTLRGFVAVKRSQHRTLMVITNHFKIFKNLNH